MLIQENAFETIVWKWRPFCLGLNMLMKFRWNVFVGDRPLLQCQFQLFIKHDQIKPKELKGVDQNMAPVWGNILSYLHRNGFDLRGLEYFFSIIKIELFPDIIFRNITEYLSRY